MTKRQLAVQIVKTLRQKGHEAYFVGGCVRDMVLKRRPYDFDIASNAGPAKIRKYFKRTIPVGERFGIIIVRLENQSFEVSTFRRDLKYRDGRRPSGVEFTDAREDALRRDFTVNGLYYDPVKGRILDWVGGVKDARRRLIRTIGSPARRFKEDKLRMLRAARFAANLDFKIEPATCGAIRRMRRRIKAVSSERIRDELIKMLTGPHPARALDWLDRTGLLEVILPEVTALKGVAQPRQFHPEGDVYKHTRLMLSLLKSPDPVLAFGALLHDIGKPATFRRAKDRIRFNGHDRVGARMAGRVLDRLRFSNELKRRITASVEGHMRFKDARDMRPATLKKFFQRDTFLTELEQHRVDCLASHGDLSIWRFVKRKLKNLSSDEIRPEPFLKGRDLIRLGLSPGPLFGRILKNAEEKQLDGDFSSKEDALKWAARFKSASTHP